MNFRRWLKPKNANIQFGSVSAEMLYWFKLSGILNAIMAIAYFLIYFHNLQNLDVVKDNVGSAVFLFFSPLLLKLQYGFLSNKPELLELAKTSGFGTDEESVTINALKLFFFLAFAQLLIQFAGNKLWHEFVVYLAHLVMKS